MSEQAAASAACLAAGKRFCDCTFGDEEWDPNLLLFAGEDVEWLPANWRNAIALPPPPYLRQQYECQYLLVLKNNERAAKKQIIEYQARNDILKVNETVQKVVGELLHGEKQATWEALRALYDSLGPTLYYFKRLFRRGRPFMCCDGIEPMFHKHPPNDPKGPPDPDYPAHAAYPSGHATKAFGLAHFYARLFPDLTDRLLAAAADIARNREVAGLHYPSDSMAGNLLAGQVVDMLLANPEFQKKAAAARVEWRPR